MTVFRNGKEEIIHHNYIMVGDLIKIKAGMNVPVDGIIVKGSGVSCNESAMTGEPDELKKEAMEVCKAKHEEKESELKFQRTADRGHHDLPSPIILSGT